MKTGRRLPVILLALPATVTAADYSRDVKPVLAKHCTSCHGALTRKAGLRLDTAAAILKGGDSGPAVEAGRPSESLLVDAVKGTDGLKMPPEGEGETLSAAEVAQLESWISQGASAPKDEAEPPDPRKHWSFQPPQRPGIPAVRDPAWARNPIDAFLAAEHEAHGLHPRPVADKDTLVRRVYLDLTGLAPSPEQRREFLADTSEDAYERLVDRLLATPGYGERWGRHWMDVWRYSDWDGFGMEVRESQPHIWRWRDWIVESLNRDEGYDRMLVAMLAADEAAPEDQGALRATGFLARNWYKFNRNVWLDSTVEHTGKAFLGITLNCARCHDHKYDPIAQDDYYKFRAFFEPHQVRTDPLPGPADPVKDGLVRVVDAEPTTPTYLFRRGDESQPDKDRPLGPGLPRALAHGELVIRTVSLPPRDYYPALNDVVRGVTLAKARAEVDAKRAALKAATRARVSATTDEAQKQADAAEILAKKDLELATEARKALELKFSADDARYATPPRPDADRLASAAARAERCIAVATADIAWIKACQAVEAIKPGTPDSQAKTSAAEKARDDARKALETARDALAKESTSYTPVGTIYPTSSTGRRLALARWVASRDNPLTARVAVNHLWMRHFGTPLVSTVFDFGLNGKGPTHPALLDWLAVEFMDRGWSMKAIHRLIVTSRAYRLQSSTDGSTENLANDPENRYLWRMNPRRMEAEVVRDNLLAAAGTLDPTIGGPDIDTKDGLTSRRRSLYFRHAKEKRVLFLRLFDSANATSCYRRTESVVPQQALALANSQVSREQARVLALKLGQSLGTDPSSTTDSSFVTLAFERILGRSPTSDERSACEGYLAEQSRRLADATKLTRFTSGPTATVKPSSTPAQRAREDLVHVLFNHNDFVTIR